MTSHPGIVVAAISWNLFHGRDDPPEDLGRLWWPGERKGEKYVQVNRSLRDEFAERLASLDWDIALLQEFPPRWFGALADAAGATGARVLTSRNSLGWVRGLIADWNPDAIASNEGGSNVTLVRQPWRIIEKQVLNLATRPERRRALMTWLLNHEGKELIVVNLHATAAGDHTRAAREVIASATIGSGWVGRDTRLIVGGDFNLRPREHPWAFEQLEDELGLTRPTSRDAVDHLLARNVELVDPPRALPDTERDVVRSDGFRVRLSDHSVVAARYGVA